MSGIGFEKQLTGKLIMDCKSILFEKNNGVAKITLSRPDDLNAMNTDMISEIVHALENAETDNIVRVVVITGNGKAFCVGADLKLGSEEFGSLESQQEIFRLFNRTLSKIENLNKPVIASINGFALAGGFEFMLACDLVIASEDALIGDQHINFGLVGAGGSTQRTTRLVGIRKAKEIIFTGERLSAREAERIGLVNKVVPADELESATYEMAAMLVERSPVALRIAKMLINRALQIDDSTAQELEVMSSLVNCTSEDSQEGMKAFNEKRKPAFKGR
jgi:enoyl-CoA hydratase/carnithine racemase